VPLEFGLQAPGTGTAGFLGGAAERGAAPGQAGGDFDFAAFRGDDERDAVGERLTLAP
jgi:hypothetical protein